MRGPSWIMAEYGRAHIARAWHIDGWPSIFVIDDRGVIRFKNVRGVRAMDKAVETLLKEIGAGFSLLAATPSLRSGRPRLRGLCLAG